MSFNEDQIDYMRDLAAMPREKKCYCAWFCVGECPHCPPTLSAADREKLECVGCGNYPPAQSLDKPIVHRRGCKLWPKGGLAPQSPPPRVGGRYCTSRTQVVQPAREG